MCRYPDGSGADSQPARADQTTGNTPTKPHDHLAGHRIRKHHIHALGPFRFLALFQVRARLVGVLDDGAGHGQGVGVGEPAGEVRAARLADGAERRRVAWE